MESPPDLPEVQRSPLSGEIAAITFTGIGD
jgi:hypothetical protein